MSHYAGYIFETYTGDAILRLLFIEVKLRVHKFAIIVNSQMMKSQRIKSQLNFVLN